MKILHTSDWHIGRSLNQESLIDDQRYALNQIIDIIENQNIDVLMIAGDIYDKSVPSETATALLDDLLSRLAKTSAQVLIISGNHDSNERLSYASNILDNLNIHIVTEYNGSLAKYSYDDVDFYLLPFIKPQNLKHLMSEDEYKNILSADDMVEYILSKESLDKNKINILMMHQFVKGSKALERSESEMNPVGTIDPISADLLKDFDYVALGHIHKKQFITDNVVYSGTPMVYAFSEEKNDNCVILYDTSDRSKKAISINPLRKIRTIKDTYENILKMPASDDIIQIILQDKKSILSPMDQIQKKMPNAISLKYENVDYSLEKAYSVSVDEKIISSPLDVFAQFYETRKGEKPSDEEIEIIRTLLEELEEENEA